MPKQDTRRLLAAALLGEQVREEAETKSSASPLDIAIAKHKLRHEAFCDEVERRFEKAMRSPNRTHGTPRQPKSP